MLEHLSRMCVSIVPTATKYFGKNVPRRVRFEFFGRPLLLRGEKDAVLQTEEASISTTNNDLALIVRKYLYQLYSGVVRFIPGLSQKTTPNLYTINWKYLWKKAGFPMAS